ncbi:threonine ammonia-lyase [Alteribacillus iranensis]|uniref:threonine ammonia-lyase n=1 Tax=Alteribacillus iranensis TaxID=930128 RepID=A0A1I2AD54_9BACI|nr:threonine/serine dehydratase [Alteribacillus iranensis]SFE41478.1 threonine dehydratase [Alteribacillus iranensis]
MITLSDIKKARETLRNTGIKQTPVLTSQLISERYQNRILFKGEHLQKTGAFKVRGAAVKVGQEVAKGADHVIAASSGNHGQAVAYHAQRLGVRSTIIAPVDAAACKKDAIETYKGNIELCGTTSEERITRAKQLAEESDGSFIPPYDDPAIMSGQGTVGLEICEQVDQLDAVYVPVGGGGLISGTATAIKEQFPHVRVIGVEPSLANDTYLSYHNGRRTSIQKAPTIADGLRASIPGELTFPVLQKYVDDIVLVSEEEIKEAFTQIFTYMKQVIEPSSAAAAAGAFKHRNQNENVVVVVSGGNVDPAVIPDLLVQ